jgi:HPt (histidine-containing phosphotransfer) domain-containing protein
MDRPGNVAAPPVDVEGFRASMRAVGIEDIVEPTLQLFVQEGAGLVSSLETFFAVGDVESLRRAAHTLKGSSGNVHAGSLARAALSLETLARQGEVAGAEGAIAEVRREYAAVVEFLTARGVG